MYLQLKETNYSASLIASSRPVHYVYLIPDTEKNRKALSSEMRAANAAYQKARNDLGTNMVLRNQSTFQILASGVKNPHKLVSKVPVDENRIYPKFSVIESLPKGSGWLTPANVDGGILAKVSQQDLFVAFTEYNLWEHERWHRFIPLRGNAKKLEALSQWCVEHNSEVDKALRNAPRVSSFGFFGLRVPVCIADSKFTVHLRQVYSLPQLECLTDCDDHGYMEKYAYLEGKLRLGRKKTLSRRLYKGGIENLVS